MRHKQSNQFEKPEIPIQLNEYPDKRDGVRRLRNIFVKSGSKYVHIEMDDILFVKVIGDYVTIHTSTDKYITHAILSVKANTQEYAIQRFKKEMVAARRNAKIRLSELKSDLMAQVMRNQSKWIKS